MKYRPSNRVYVLTFTALLVVTTSIAAAPVRHALAPLLGHPLSQWLGHAPSKPSTVQQSADVALAIPAEPAQLDADSRVVSYIASSGQAAAGGSERAERVVQSWASDGGPRRGDNSSGSRESRFAGTSFGFNRGAIGSRFGNANTYNRASDNHDSSGSGNQASSESSRSTTASRSTRGGSSDRQVDDSDRKESNDATKEDKHNDSDGLFGEHRSGLPKLKGGHKDKNTQAPGAGIGAAGTVAVNPEPSSLFLLGTGIFAVAGAIRRRLR